MIRRIMVVDPAENNSTRMPRWTSCTYKIPHSSSPPRRLLLTGPSLQDNYLAVSSFCLTNWTRDCIAERGRTSVDEDHAMDACLHLLLLASLAFVSHAAGKLPSLKLCVVGNPQIRSTRTTKYCELLAKSKKSPVSCIYAPDRLECLLAVSRRTADFSVFEAEDLYFSTLWDESSILVVSEIRALKQKAFRYGVVAMVRKDGNITGIGDLKGKRLCHPGFDSGPEWEQLFAQYFEERVAPASCDEQLSLREDRIRTTSNFFGSACKAGPWSPRPDEDSRLKQKYWNLCSLCEGGDCGNSDKHRGSGGSIICFKDGVGDVLWARYEDVKADIQFLQSGSTNPASEYYYLCDNGTLMSLTSEEPCFWLGKPWQVVGASRKSASGVQKILDALSDDEHNDWEENLLHIIELYLEYIQNLVVSRTPEDYLRRIPGYLSASAMSQSNCKPRHSVNMCVTSAIEGQKCDWMSKAGSALGIQPSLECVQKANVTACLDSVEKGETDVVSVAPDFFYDATAKYNLKAFLLESGSEFKDNYLASAVVKKKSAMKSLSDLKGKKVCLTRKHGIGWWGLTAALHRESLMDSCCGDLSRFFGEVCVLNVERKGLKRCCPEMADTGTDETDLLHCLHEDGCDAAILDSNTLTETLGGRNSPSWSKDFRLSDLKTLCGTAEKTANCHWVWSHPNYLMSHAETTSRKADEIFGVFFQLGEYFGRNSRKGNEMLEIFGPFHEVRNVLFRDTSTSFVASVRWNHSNSYPEVVERVRLCSEAPLGLTLSLLALLLLLISAFPANPLLTFL